MKKLLEFESRKLFKGKFFYICLVLSLVSVLLDAATKLLISKVPMPEEIGEYAALLSVNGFAYLKTVFDAGNLNLIMAIAVALFVSEDYSVDTIKNIYSKGYTRSSVFVSKYLVSLLMALSFIVADMALGFLVGTAFGGLGAAGENYILSVIAVIVLACTYHAVFFSVSVIIKKTGGAIALSILLPFLALAVLALADALLKSQSFQLVNYSLSYQSANFAAPNVDLKYLIVTLGVNIAVSLALVFGAFAFNKNRDS